jgi:spectinomycin phosphotransferase
MLEKPNIADELILFRLQNEYSIHVDELKFHSSGDLNNAAYEAVTEDGTKYFLKLRRAFEETVVTVPLFLKAQGIEAIIVPKETSSHQYWADFNEYEIILYPFVEGKNGFEIELSDRQKRKLGLALKEIHSTHVPLKLKKQIPQEVFSPKWRETIKLLQVQAQDSSFQDPMAARLAAFIKSRKDSISHLVQRTEQLAARLQSQPLELVLCHSDVHGRNMLITEDNQLFIVDWDNPILAPKERDLMFIGGGIDNIWKSERDQALFYEGYGKPDTDQSALAYYRYERVIQDLADYGAQVLLSNEGSEIERETYCRYFMINIDENHRIEIAKQTDPFN